MTDFANLGIRFVPVDDGAANKALTDVAANSVKAEDARNRARELAERNLALQASLDTLSEGACLFDSKRHLVAWNEPLIRLLGIQEELESVIGTHAKLAHWCVSQRGLDRPQAVEWRRGDGPRISTECVLDGRNFIIRSVSLPAGGMAYAFDDVTDRIRFQRALTETAETLERRVEQRTAELVEVNRKLIDAKNEAALEEISPPKRSSDTEYQKLMYFWMVPRSIPPSARTSPFLCFAAKATQPSKMRRVSASDL